MRAFLIFLSSLLGGYISCTASGETDSTVCQPSNLLKRYVFQIDTSKATISGLLLVTDEGDSIKGSMINEFGISALDFLYTKSNRKIKLFNVVKFLNRWYIKRTLTGDIKYCLQVLYDLPGQSSQKHETVRTDENISVINRKRNIKYTFSPLIDRL